MTLIGDANLVGVQLDAGPMGFCGIRLWLKGHPVGDPALYGTTGALVEQLARFRSRAFERVNPMLFRESSQRCLDIIYDTLFDANGDLADSVSSIQQYGAFLLSPNLCESLDDYLVVVVSDGREQRIVTRHFIDSDVLELRVPESTIEHVFEDVEEALA